MSTKRFQVASPSSIEDAAIAALKDLEKAHALFQGTGRADFAHSTAASADAIKLLTNGEPHSYVAPTDAIDAVNKAHEGKVKREGGREDEYRYASSFLEIPADVEVLLGGESWRRPRQTCRNTRASIANFSAW